MPRSVYLVGCLADRPGQTGWRAQVIFADNDKEAMGSFIIGRQIAESDVSLSATIASEISDDTVLGMVEIAKQRGLI